MARILFQGDSITDAGRNREVLEPNEPKALGSGYVNLLAAKVLREKPQDALEFLNRGVSGDRSVDLYARWKKDALNLQPDVLSILVGVNDVWHEFVGQNGVESARFETLYRLLLEFTRQSLPHARIIVCEPFLLPCGVVKDDWLTDMHERRTIVQHLAGEVGATFVPFQAAFDKALETAPPDYWAKDGVHPTPAGHQLLADTWLEHVSRLPLTQGSVQTASRSRRGQANGDDANTHL